jgi:hypothetical protein
MICGSDYNGEEVFLGSNPALSSRIGWPGRLLLSVAGDEQSPREADSMAGGKELKLTVQGPEG